MVITKDLSRLGRDHIETDNYIEKWFPLHNVRYVSILDGVDTFNDNSNNDIAPIKNWINDMYAKDTSRKIKKEFRKMMYKGLWTGGEPPLGYQIDPQNKHHFIIDHTTAEIVKKIFNLAKQNNSLDNICNILIKENIPIPTILKGNKRKNNLLNIWSSDTIRKILKNETYLGHMIQGKTAKINYKSKKIVSLSQEDWIKVKNTHAPIIDQETFNIVQLLIKSNKNKTKKTYDYLFKGLIKCKECKHTIGIQHYKKRKSNYTICNYYRKYGNKKNVCTSHRFIYEEIEKLIIKNIKDNCLKYINKENLIIILKQNSQNKLLKNDLELKINKCNLEINKLKKHIEQIYEDKLNNIITEEEYIKISKEKKNILNLEKEKLIKYKNNFNQLTKEDKIDYKQIINNFITMKNINKILITNLIDTIYLNKNGTIDIYYKIKNPQP